MNQAVGQLSRRVFGDIESADHLVVQCLSGVGPGEAIDAVPVLQSRITAEHGGVF